MGILKERVHPSSNVCSNCFRRIADTYDPNYVVNLHGGLHDDVVPIRESVREMLSGIRVVNERNVERERGDWVCECGAISPYFVVRSPRNALSLDAARQCAWRALARVAEFAQREPDRDAFMATVERMKTDPEHSNMDDYIFDRASEASLRSRPDERPPRQEAQRP